MSNLNRQRGKAYERFIAADLGGRRMGILGREDVELPLISAECKEREVIPKFLTDIMEQATRNARQDRFAVSFLHECGKSHEHDLVIMKYADWKIIYANFKNVRLGG